jgi:hypothetical protein
MAITDVSLCSRALVGLGAGSISSFDEESDRATICRETYPGMKAALLSKYAWRFLMTKKLLTRDAVAPIGEWTYSYIVPGEALSGAAHAVFYSAENKLAANRYELFGRRIYTDEAVVYVDFVADQPESAWPAYFQQLMVYAFRAEVAFAITDQQGVADHWHAMAYGSPSEAGLGGAFGDAMTLDAQGSANIGLRNDALVDARFGSWQSEYDFQWPGPA